MIIISRYFLTFFLLCLTCLSQIAIAIPVSQLPLNQTPLVDQAQILTESETQTLNQRMRNWYKADIMQAGVVIVDSSDGEDDFSYAMEIFERWQLGDKDKNNGLLLFINFGEHKLRIITGYGLEAVLPDISIKRIIDQDITPEFKKNAYFTGIEKGLNAMIEQVTADPEIRSQMIAADKAREESRDRNAKITAAFFPLIIIFNIILNLILRSISFLRPKKGLRFFISLFSIVSILGFITIFFGIDISVLFPSAIMAIIIGTAIGDKSSYDSHAIQHYVFPRNARVPSFSSSQQNYRGGGGSSGGGGAGGSW